MKAYIYSKNNLKGLALSAQTTQGGKPVFHLSVPTQSCRLWRSGLSSVTARCHRPAAPCGSPPLRPSGTRAATAPLTPGHYNSQQAAGRREEVRGGRAARVRTAVSSMATVLSRALKLPGKGCAPAGGTGHRPGRAERGRGRPGQGRAGAALITGGAGAAA